MFSFSQFGNDLHSGKTSFAIIGRRKLWYLIAAVMVALSVLVPIVRGGFNLGIEFRGGSEFRVTGVESATAIKTAETAMAELSGGVVPKVAAVGASTVLVQTEQLSSEESQEARQALAKALSVGEDQVASSFIGPTWGADVTRQALLGLVIFLVLVCVVMSLYFRTWKMSVAALVALGHDLVLTVGVYAATGFEVTPATIIGFLTILGYSLYDTVVVFDKIRENTANLNPATRENFRSQVNLAVNQTLVRSINTSVVAVLPVGAILFIGAFLLGAGTLRDISLALFIGIIAGTYSTIFIATPLYAQLREKEFPSADVREPVPAR